MKLKSMEEIQKAAEKRRVKQLETIPIPYYDKKNKKYEEFRIGDLIKITDNTAAHMKYPNGNYRKPQCIGIVKELFRVRCKIKNTAFYVTFFIPKEEEQHYIVSGNIQYYVQVPDKCIIIDPSYNYEFEKIS
jgi:hypothetical protein